MILSSSPFIMRRDRSLMISAKALANTRLERSTAPSYPLDATIC
jgi:hypothetical protein